MHVFLRREKMLMLEESNDGKEFGRRSYRLEQLLNKEGP
jgi:hypothetical protein